MRLGPFDILWICCFQEENIGVESVLKTVLKTFENNSEDFYKYSWIIGAESRIYKSMDKQ